MKNRITKCMALVAVLCVLATAFAVPLASAASYSKVYGKTQDKVRVRENASTNATIIDNIIKGACVYVTSSKESGGNTFIKVNYRAEDGEIESGWICQNDGDDTYVKILSASQAEDEFSVKGGNLPSKRVGTFTDSQRKVSGSSDDSYIREGSSGATVRSIQTKLKALDIYTGEITGNAGEKTVAAIKKFQERYGLTADGVAGPQTIARIDAVYEEKGGSSSSSSSGGSGLKLGSTGTDVRDLQSDLTTLGYYWAEITGNFGNKTEEAVIRFQKEKGLTADGVAGSKTIAAIASAMAGKGGSSSSSSSSSTGSTLKLNSQGDAVSELQSDLKALGYYYADITGNFGEKTEAAVKEFQEKNGLTADGIAGKKTLEAIAGKIGSSETASSGSGMKLGSTGTKVRALQEDLTTLGYYYGDITGHYGNMTKTAVTKFQKSRGLTQDGVAGASTVAAIESALSGSGALSGGSSVSSNSLKEGDNGSAVLDLQTRLKSLNYYYGDLTGSYGSLTKKAVRSFQDDNDLTVDGIAGTKTLNKLYSLTGGGSISSGSTSSGSVVDTDESYGRINKDNVNLRSSYSTSSAAKASLDEGELVRITKVYTISGVNWYYITAEEGGYTYKGYVRSDMVDLISESDYNAGGGDIDTGNAEIIGMIRITADKVNMRKEASSDSDSVGYAYTGDVFYYIDTEDGWFQTKSGYWINREYAKVMTEEEVNSYVGSDSSTGGTYSEGDTGSTVKWIQTALKELDYYDGELSGHYGNKTKEAVRQFQRDHDISADGVAGPKTIAKIQEEYGAALNSSSGTTTSKLNQTIYNINWFDHQDCIQKSGVSRGASLTLTDVDTGRSFGIKVQSSSGNHADVEPSTSSDTQVLCSLYGVTSASQLESQDKYQRRAVVVTTSSGVQFVGSIYAIPHGSDTVSGNNFDGQFCLHFAGSKTHGTDRVDTDKGGHQDMISKAVTYLKTQKTADGKSIVISTKCGRCGK